MKKSSKILLTTVLFTIILISLFSYSTILNKTKKSQENLINNFLDNLYTIEYLDDEKTENYLTSISKNIKPFLVSDYEVDPIIIEGTTVYPSMENQSSIKYSNYSINQISKEKLDDTKGTLYNLNVNFTMKNKNTGEETLSSNNSTSIYLVKENSQWKINNLIIDLALIEAINEDIVFNKV